MRSRPENPMPSTLKRSAVNPMIQLAANSSAIRRNIASESPTIRARFCCSRGSFAARIEMKTTLSMPSTISSTSSVAKAMSSSGLKASSMVAILLTAHRLGSYTGVR